MANTNCQVLTVSDGAIAGKQYKILAIYPKLKSYLLKTGKILEMKQLNGNENKIIVKSKVEGFLCTKHVKPGDIIELGIKLLTVEDCLHPTLMGNICCDCGTVLDMGSTEGHVAMLHSIPDLKVSRKEAERLGAEDISNLLKRRRLVLLVDLDQTLIHTTNDNVPPKLKDVYHFQFTSNVPFYHTRLRPYTKQFLENMSKLYELHICTFGARDYAHSIAKFLDPHGNLFGPRILSRNECLDPMSKKGNLNSLFPCGDNLVCIIDDRSDVWNFAPNVVQVLPYHFFRHTGDINAPPGLQKKEDDETKGFDFTQIEPKLVKTERSVTAHMLEPKSIEETDKELDVGVSTKDNSYSESSSEISESIITNDEDVREDSEPKNEDSNLKLDEIEESKMDCEENESVPEIKVVGKPIKNSVDENKDQLPIVSLKNDIMEVFDSDDYLLYLEDILKKLHSRFYKFYDDCCSPLPDLKQIVPSIRAEVLKGVNIVFSSVIPNHVNLRNSKPYHVAASLGARVSEQIIAKPHQFATTHLITANLHTEKSKQAKKLGLNIVNPNWLWCCAERWESVEEQLFPVDSLHFDRLPPLHCLSPIVEKANPGTSCEEKREGNLIENINPLLYFSVGDTKYMKDEVDTCMSDGSDNESSDSSEKHFDDSLQNRKRKRTEEDSPESSDSSGKHFDDSLQNLKRKTTEEDSPDSEDDQLPSVIFRQGDVPSDLSDDSDNEIDEDLNAYGEMLEREMMDLN